MPITMRVDPAEPGIAVRGGHFTLTVTVRNPTVDSLVVILPPSGDTAPSVAFGFTLSGEEVGLWHAERAWDAEVTTFGPGEERRLIFDFMVKPRFDGVRGLPPGTYRMQGGFGSSWSAPATVVLAP
jgi:hypothetical protein